MKPPRLDVLLSFALLGTLTVSPALAGQAVQAQDTLPTTAGKTDNPSHPLVDAQAALKKSALTK